ncbi:MAG: YihY/virulence factor BrkB family protein [Clostridiales bacterium]|nr:YihY/virulence factor BrkB family protein [Clostridiales bacterium]
MSRVCSLAPAVGLAKRLAHAAARDQVTLRAAEASFFLITSAVPFCSLLLSLTGALLADSADVLLDRLPLPGEYDALLGALVRELSDTPGVPLLSVSAAATLWSASRGISAVRRGLRLIFGGDAGSPIARRLKPVAATVAALLASAAFLFVSSGAIPFCFGRTPGWAEHLVSFLSLSAAILLVYRAAGGGRGSWKGALTASVGWMAFEALDPLAFGADFVTSPLWGAFAAVTLLMLRLYFRMLLLFLGAEAAILTPREPIARKEANRCS